MNKIPFGNESPARTMIRVFIFDWMFLLNLKSEISSWADAAEYHTLLSWRTKLLKYVLKLLNNCYSLIVHKFWNNAVLDL